jgi:uncharacterized protein (DUF58 family)
MEKLVADIFQGAYKSRFKGRGIEFEEAREYIAGDDIRSIDWNVTARMNAPYVKNFREERELTVMLLVDISASSEFGTGEKTKKDIIAEIGSLIAFSAIKNNDKIGLLLFSDQIELYVPPKKGVRHVQRLMRELLVREPKGRKTDLRMALTYFGKIMSRSTICFLISDFINEGYDNELRVTARKHDLICVRVFDNLERDLPNFNLLEFTDLESGKTVLVDSSSSQFREFFRKGAVERAIKTKNLIEGAGAGLIEVNANSDYFKAFEIYFRSKRGSP